MRTFPEPPMTDEQAKKESADRDRRERQDKLRRAKLARIRYDLALNELGMDEVPVLEFSAAGIEPQMRVIEVPPEQLEANREQLSRLQADLEAMSGLA